MSVMVPDLLTPEQVGERLGYTPRYVLRLAREGKLPRVKLGRRSVRFRPDDVRAYIHAHHESGAEQSQVRLFDDEEERIPSRF